MTTTKNTQQDTLNILTTELTSDPKAALQQVEALVQSSDDHGNELLQQLIQSHPYIEPLWHLLAQSHKQNGAEEAAKQALEQLDMIHAFNTELQFAHQAFANNDFALTDKICRKLLQQIPGEIRVFRLMAQLALKLNRSDIAITLLKQSYENRPWDTGIVKELVQAYLVAKDWPNAANLAEKYFEKLNDDSEFLSLYGHALVKTAQYTHAVEIYERLVSLNPEQGQYLLRLGNVLKIIGDTEKAVTLFTQATSLPSAKSEAYWNLANLKTHEFDNEQKQDINETLSSPALSAQDKMFLHFANGTILEQSDIELSFKHYQQANQLAEQQHPSDYRDDYQSLIKHITDHSFSTYKPTKKTKTTPIFIVGLPRSGSTLVEQILASHSDVEGTMELNAIPAIAQSLALEAQENKLNLAEAIHEMSDQKIDHWRAQYLDHVAQLVTGSAMFIDKLPANFVHIGLIKKLFPEAKIVDVRRHPMACGWSIYKQLFASGVSYANDLQKIAKHIKSYEGLMEHWNKVLPEQIHTVKYEDLIDDFDQQIEALCQYCGLEVEQQCKDFHNVKRPVATPSAEQVRQPLYTTAKDQWKQYESHLTQLANALTD